MNEQTINQIKELLAPIGEKIGQGAEFGWEVVMKQQTIIAVSGILWVLFGIIILFTIYKVVSNGLKKDEYFFEEVWPVLLIFFGGIAGIVMIVGGTSDAVTHFINPEYYAIEFFIGLVK